VKNPRPSTAELKSGIHAGASPIVEESEASHTLPVWPAPSAQLTSNVTFEASRFGKMNTALHVPFEALYVKSASIVTVVGSPSP